MADSADPHDLQAERAVLGAVLVDDATAFDVAADVLVASDFYRSAHGQIWRAMASVRQREDSIHLHALQDTLQAAGQLDAIGGLLYLVGLTDGVPRTCNVAYFAKRVHDTAQARGVLSALTATAKAISDDGGVSTDTLATLKVLVDTGLGASVRATLDHERQVAESLRRERATRDARRRLEAEERPPVEIPDFDTLTTRLARPRMGVRSRVEGWFPENARVMLTAQFKAGKSTLVGNVLRSLVDGDAFLGVARVTPISGSAAVLDFEMAESQLDEWLRAQQIRRGDSVRVIPLRGRATAFDILTPEVRRRWATRLRDAGVTFLILDCLRPVLDALGLDEHRDAGRFLVAFDALLADAGITEALVVHHMGHSGERARGDSRLRDWPDVEWRLIREGDDPSGPRYITAFGRDVDIPERRLDYDASARRLTLADGSRRQSAGTAALNDVLAYLSEAGTAQSGRAIERALADTEHPRAAIKAALRLGLKPGGGLQAATGAKRAILYSLSASAPVLRSALPVRRITSYSQCASAPVPIGHGAQSTDTGRADADII